MEKELTYIEMLQILQESLETDCTIPDNDYNEITETISSLVDLLWAFSA